MLPRLTDAERAAIFGRIRADRLARGGRPPPPDPVMVAREVAATQWLAGVDARPWLPALPLGYRLPGMPPDPRLRRG